MEISPKPLEWFGGEVTALFDGQKWAIMFVGKPVNGVLAAGDSFMILVDMPH